jgi:hypothetical protein
LLPVARKKKRLHQHPLLRRHQPLIQHLQRPQHLLLRPPPQPQPLLLKKRKTKRSNSFQLIRKAGALSAGFFIHGRF